MASQDPTQAINRQIGGNPLGNAVGLYSGLRKGGVTGYGTALADYGKLTGGSYGGYLGNALGIYSGLQRGGVQGYGTAAVDALKLAGSPAAGYLAAPLAVYNFAQNWQSGATASDTLQGAEAGAAVGSIIPGVGTLIGGAIGAGIGAISSAFGSGMKDPENVNFEQMKNAYNKNPAQGQAIVNSIPNKYLSLAGLFDLRGGQIGGNIPIYKQYGRMGEQQFTIDMTDKINQALAAGTIAKTDSPQTIMQKVVTPWINGFGKGQWTDVNSNAINAVLQGMVMDYQNGNFRNWKAIGGDYPFANTIKPFGALGVGQQTQAAPKLAQQRSAGKPMATNDMYAGGPGGNTLAFSGAGDLGNLGQVTGGSQSGSSSAYPGITGPSATPPTPSTGGLGSFLGNLGTGFLGSLLGGGGGSSGLGGQLGSFLGGIAPSLGTAAVGLNQVKQAQQQNQQLQQQEAALGQPFLDASKQQLQASQAGTLSPAQQAVVNTATQQGQNLINQTGPLSQIFQQSFANYQSGTLQPAQQAQLDQQVAAAKAELRQALGPNADSSTLATQDAQIDQQALITKQNMLNSQFQTGNQAYDTWMQSTQQGQQLILQGQQYAAQQLQQDLTNALQLGSEGMAPVEQSINMAISSDADLSNQVNQLMSNLASSWAYMQAKGGAGGAGSPFGGGQQVGTGMGGIPGVGNIVGQYGMGNLSGLLPTAQDPSQLQSPVDLNQLQDPSNLGIDPSILNQGNILAGQGNILDQTGDISSPTYDWMSGTDPGSFDMTGVGGG